MNIKLNSQCYENFPMIQLNLIHIKTNLFDYYYILHVMT